MLGGAIELATTCEDRDNITIGVLLGYIAAIHLNRPSFVELIILVKVVYYNRLLTSFIHAMASAGVEYQVKFVRADS